jgi:DNA-binding XRE family transcriptional regulator
MPVIFICIIFTSVFSHPILADQAYNLSDVALAQDSNSSNIQTMQASVDSDVEYNGQTQTLSYDYTMQKDDNGNSKVMVTTKGKFTMQFIVDTSDMSVTYLMADGSYNKVTLSAEDQAQVQQMAGLSGMMGQGLREYYASAAGLSRQTMTDAVVEKDLNKPEIETANTLIKINRNDSSRDYAYVEYNNKQIKKMKIDIDAAIDKAVNTPAKSEGERKMKKKYMDYLNNNRENIKRYQMAKKRDKINMKSGIVEETEMFNEQGERIGHVWVKSKNKRTVKAPKHKYSMGKSVLVASAGGPVLYITPSGTDTVEVELPTETEVEMQTTEGVSKTHTKMNNMKINEDIEFKWMDVKAKTQEGTK